MKANIIKTFATIHQHTSPLTSAQAAPLRYLLVAAKGAQVAQDTILASIGLAALRRRRHLLAVLRDQ